MRDLTDIRDWETEHAAAMEVYESVLQKYYSHDLKGAAGALSQTVDMFKELKDYTMLAKAYNLMGVVYAAIGSTAMEVEGYLSALKCAKENGLEYAELLSLNNLGSHFQEINEHEKAMQYFRECYAGIRKKNLSEANTKGLYLVLLENMLLSSMKLNSLSEAVHYLEAADRHLEEQKINATFDILLLRNMLDFRQGRKEKVWQNLPRLEEMIMKTAEPADILPQLKEYTALLKEMGAEDFWSRILDYAYRNTKKYNSNSMRMAVIELCLDYAEALGKKEDYATLCHLYVETAMDMKEEVRQEKQQITDVKIELYEKEQERVRTQKEKQAMQKLAETDALTGLGSRYSLKRYGRDLLEKAKEERTHLTVGILDIDYFKQFNDTYGHVAGDKCLIEVAQVLRDMVKVAVDLGACGRVFRYGGDELLVLLVGLPYDGIDRLAKTIVEEMKKRQYKRRELQTQTQVTLSQGYYMQIPKDEDLLEDILKKADVQLYKIKENARDGYLITVGP